VVVKNVIIYNREGHESGRLSRASVSIIDSAGKTLESVQLGNINKDTYKGGIIDIKFGLNSGASDIIAWKSPSSTGEPLLSDQCKTQLAAQFRTSMDSFDIPIALVFGNKTTIGQVCSFAKGLTSSTVSSIPGFCCLDAPYQSKAEEWGEKVRSWWGRRVVQCSFSSD
jgi:hypothetical protein